MYIFNAFYLLHSYKPSFLICLCFNLVSFRGQEKLGPHPDQSPSKFLTSIPAPFICGVAPPPPPSEDMSCPSHMLSNCDSKEKQETACSLAPTGHPNNMTIIEKRKQASALRGLFFPLPSFHIKQGDLCGGESPLHIYR